MLKKLDFNLTYRWDPIRYFTPGQSGPENNSNREVPHIPHSSKTHLCAV